MTTPTGRPTPSAALLERPVPVWRDRRRAVLARLGDVVLTLGVVVLLFGVYELAVTGWQAADAQGRASGELDRLWQGPVAAPVGAEPPAGRPILRLHVPALGEGWVRTVLEGVGPDVLAEGPGLYPGSAEPGKPGNLAIAGHRVTYGGPFDGVADLPSCAPLVVETRQEWLVYRVLPRDDAERARWDTLGRRPDCAGVVPLGGDYAATPGREVVAPEAVDVLAPVPHRPGAVPQVPVLTLTTCHPRFSAAERLVVHAVLVTRYPRPAPGAGPLPPELGG